MSTLDINTERGRNTLWDEIEAIQILKSHWPDCVYVHTDKEGTASVDGLILRHERVFAVAETKCRQNTLADLIGPFRNTWLVTYDKLKRAAQAADLLDVTFWGLLYLVPDRTLLRIKLYYRGAWLVPIKTAHTKTQRTVNGGEIVRENAFIDMTSANILRERSR